MKEKFENEHSLTKLLDEQYLEDENRSELDYWEPFSRIITESISLRYLRDMSQTDLAKIMNTKQSVISRFENMGRLPNYDFIARLSIALGHIPGITLQGDYMAIVPLEKQQFIKELAEQENTPTRKFVQKILEQGIEVKKQFNMIDIKGEILSTGEVVESETNINNQELCTGKDKTVKQNYDATIIFVANNYAEAN